jgi:hypothetical protein
LLGGLFGDAAEGEVPAVETVFGILNQINEITGPRSEEDDGPALDLRTLLDRMRERRGERGGLLSPREDRSTESDGDSPNGEAAPLRNLFRRLLPQNNESPPPADAEPREF